MEYSVSKREMLATLAMLTASNLIAIAVIVWNFCS